MADKNEILIALEAKAVQNSLAAGLKDLDNFVFKAQRAEQAVASLQQQLQTLAGPQLLRNMRQVGNAIGGAFDRPAFQLQALQRQIKEFRAQNVNLLAELGDAQARYARKVGTAVREQQISGFIRRNTLSDIRKDNDLASLQSRAEAERRLQNASVLSGGTVGVRSENRLAEIEQKIKRIQDLEANARRADIRDRGVTERLQANEFKQATAIGAVEAARTRVKQAELELDRARLRTGGQITADVQQRIQAVQNEKRELERVRQVTAEARRAARPQATPQETAERVNANVRARFGLNNGADIFKLQTQILANYQLVNLALGSIRGAYRFTVQFEQSLKELQAIVGATNGEVAKLSNTFLDLSTTTRYTGTEIARAAVVMGQAGLSATQIDTAIRAVTQLAVATGTDLKLAVDLTTSVMGIFNLRAAEMANVANIVSAALNQSKLDGQKLALGLQYAGNIAATTGVSFIELTTALAAMSNAGVKSGSTLGTGTRQLIQDLAAPSEKLKERLDRLNVSIADIDIKSQGFFGVLKNLQEAGFTTTDALETMELRGAAAFANLSKQLPNVEAMQIAIAETGDAAKANATQMESADSAVKRLGASAGAFVSRVSGPLVSAFKLLVNTLADALAYLAKFSDEIEIFVTFIGVTAAAAITRWITLLTFSLVGLGRLAAGIAAVRTAIASATTVTAAFTGALGALSISNPLFLGISLAVTAAAVAFTRFGESSSSLPKELDDVNTAINESKGRLSESTAAYENINKEIDTLNSRYERLTANNDELQAAIAEINNKFRDMGFYVTASTTSIGVLIEKLRDLSDEQRRQQQVELEFQTRLLKNNQNIERRSTERLFSAEGSIENLGSFGRSGLTKTRIPSTDLRETASAVDVNAFQLAVDISSFTGKRIRERIELTARAAAAARKIDADSSAQVEERIGELTFLFRDIGLEIDEIQKNFGTIADREISQLTNLSQVIDSYITRLKSQKGSEAQVKAAEIALKVRKNLDVNDLRAIQDLKEFGLRRRSEIDKNLQVALDNKVDKDIAKKAYNDDLVELVRIVEADYNKIINNMTKQRLDAFRASGLEVEYTNFFGELRKASIEANIELHKIAEDLLKATNRRLKREIQSTKKRINSSTEAVNLIPIEGELNDLYAQLRDNELLLAANKRKQLELQSQTTTQVATDIEIRETIQSEWDSSLEQWGNYVDSFRENIENVDKKIELFADEIKTFGTAFEQIQKTLKRSTDAAKNVVEAQNARIAAARLRLNGNADNISDVQVQQERNKLERIQLEADKNKLSGLRAAVGDLDKLDTRYTRLIGEFEGRIAKLKEEREELRKTLLGGGNSKENQNQFNKKKAEELALEAQLLTLVQKQASLREFMKTTTQEQKQLEEDLLIRQERQTPITIGEGFAAALQQYRIEQELMKEGNAELIDNFKGMFGIVSGAFKTFVNDTTSGTKTISQSFKDMALNILKSMQELAAEMAAKGLLKILFAFVSKAFTPAPEGIPAPDPALDFFRLGGSVGLRRAVQGTYAAGRDSVPALLMPGEYVVRKNVVDSLGVDFMNRLNSMGARALDMAVPLPANSNGGERGDLNVWVVAPDQVPPPGPRDIIATVASDLTTGGITKQLVKKIAGGGM